MTRFLHMGDVHIGRERLEGALPSQDFADAFNQIVETAVGQTVDFVLIAGDFFDRARIEPNHLAEAEVGLRRLGEARIPVVAIEGNHDVASTYDERPSWLSYLNACGRLRLLRTEFRDGRPIMKEWTDRDRVGNWLDLAGARIYGAGWFGASTAKRLELLAPHLEKKGFTILMLHAGLAGMAEEFSMITREQLAVVRERIDYAALGHLHRRYVVDGYAYNAGAPEHWELKEAGYGDEKGYWLVEIGPGGGFTARPGTVKRRPVHLATFSCQGLKGVDEVLERVAEAARSWPVSAETAVQLKLTGLPAFNTAELDRKAVEERIVRAAGCKAADVLPAFGRRAGESAETELALPRDVLEAEEIDKLIAETGRYARHAETVRNLVRHVLTARTDEELHAGLLQQAAPIIAEEARANP